MIVFDQLRLSDNAQKMYIHVHVNKASYFDNIYLERIIILPAEKVMEATYATQYPTDSEGNPVNYLYTKKFEGEQKEAELVLTANDFVKTWETEATAMNFKQEDMQKTLFFVYVQCKGSVGMCTPCTLDELMTVGVVFDEKLLHQKVMGYIKDLSKDCSVPQGFANFILLWNAFKASIETDHYLPAIKFWNLLFGTGGYGTSGITSKGCGCNG